MNYPDFRELYGVAVVRKEGPENLENMLPQASSADTLRAIPDDRWLSSMTKRVFQSGFVWRVVENKWPDFETVFHGFAVDKVLGMPEPELDAAAADTRLIRNRTKIYTVPQNAGFVQEISAEYGSFGAFVADWPDDDIVGLWEVLKKRGARLGGNSGPFFLRSMGKDTFLFTGDVVSALETRELIGKNPYSKQSMRAAQDVFNAWREQTGRSLCQLSRILACTVAGEARDH